MNDFDEMTQKVADIFLWVCAISFLVNVALVVGGVIWLVRSH